MTGFVTPNSVWLQTDAFWRGKFAIDRTPAIKIAERAHVRVGRNVLSCPMLSRFDWMGLAVGIEEDRRICLVGSPWAQR